MVPHPSWRRWLPLVTWITLAVVVTGAWAYALSAARGSAALRERLLAEQTALRVNDWMASRLLVLEKIRIMELAGHFDEPGDWTRLNTLDIELLGGFQAINRLDGAGTITDVAPVAGNEAALGRSVYEHPVGGPALGEAVAARSRRLSAPLELFQGGRGLTAYLPIVEDDELVGVVNGVFRTEHLIDTCFADLEETHHVSLTDGAETLVELHPDANPSGAYSMTLPVENRVWTLSVSPRLPPVPTTQALPVLLVLLVLVTALALLMRLALDRDARAAAADRHGAMLRAQLDRSERLEALGRLAGGMAHDFNNVLTVVMGSAELIEARIDAGRLDTDALRRLSTRIHDASTRASQLTGQLLAFARREPLDAASVDAANHVMEIAPMLANLATEAVAVGIDVPDEPVWARCSATVLDRVLVNLVSNARQAMPLSGGTITIHVVPDRGGVCIVVTDDGHGMEPDVLERVFEPLFTTRATGNGLGLASVYGLVTQRGGTIGVVSEPGVGTTFDVWFPAGEPLVDLDDEEPSIAAMAISRRVVLVEDDNDVRAVVRMALADHGFGVQAFDSAAAALAGIDGPFDVLITDLVMPGQDGASLAIQLKTMHPDIEVIIMSGYAESVAAVERAAQAGARVLTKPLDLSKLVKIVQRLGHESGAEQNEASNEVVS